VSPQVISLPKGGGAISGIGETFSPDLFTGTGNVTVPIGVPAGRNGFQPEINLVYSTGNGNGPFGLGWDLSLASVTRKTSKGVPQYRDDAVGGSDGDTFVLSGTDELTAVSDLGSGRSRFRPLTETAFALIDRVRTSEEDFWEVASRDGSVSRYGHSGSAGGGPAVVADPSDRRRVFSWRLTGSADPFGNLIESEWLRDAGSKGLREWDQVLLRQVPTWITRRRARLAFWCRSHSTTRSGRIPSRTIALGSRSAPASAVGVLRSAPTPIRNV